MPSYALDANGCIVSADAADPFGSYHCLECKKALRKRSGRIVRPHFYHLRTSVACRLYSRSIDHLCLQTHLKELVPALELERPFPKILRIADLCWEEEKCVFEIQCSPIEPQEALRRRADYSREGYALIWLLDDRLYNKKRLRLAETEMRSLCCYFFSLKKMRIYDQFEVIFRESRLFKGPPLPLHLSRPKISPGPLFPALGLDRAPFYFTGDLFDYCLRFPRHMQKMVKQKKQLLLEHRPRFWAKQALLFVLFFLLETLLSRIEEEN